MRLIDADELPEVNTIERIEGEREVFVNSWIPATAIWKAPTVEAIPIDKPFLKMKYKGYTVYKTEWLKEHIEMEYRVIKGISETKAEAIPVRHGKWVKISPANIYECSKCGKNVMTNDISEYNFCHGCGADMRGERKENEID